MGIKSTHKPGFDVLIIARHGRPALSRKVRLTWREYRDWWQAYDAGGLADDQIAPNGISTLAQEADLVVSSTLPRAMQTAHIARSAAADLVDVVFVEAPLPPPHLPLLKLRPKTWGTLARICWFWGFPDGMETVDEARIRAGEAAEMLEREASGGKLVLLTAHGWFNRMIRTQLVRRGWVCTENQGDLHWKYRRFERKTAQIHNT
ncbi:histidine phosphatase family protein [Robiginitomaculum antarcticum]|uniref:histidine phosphatase family protein n=1 Tax=Robiginitomaculum antarcticum TaxID=437507 RepID=UPI00035C34F9|nr:phosphoglycerate mutase family protein [Robiginitomaculum antarcticum]